MQSESFIFPQYRKYVGLNTWYKIESTNLFIEVSKLGDNFIQHSVEAKQYPEKLRIMDMLNCHHNTWEIIDEATFDKVFFKVK